MLMQRIGWICSTLVLISACGGSEPPPAAPPPPPPPAPGPSAAVAPPAEPAPSATAPASEPPKAPAKPEPVLRYTDGIGTPESVLYDESADRYLVSNINGKPNEADNNGTIAELSPDGKVTNPKFIAGGVNKVKLDAPKGSGILDGIFYVTDIKVVRKFDAKTGAPKGDIVFPGATFLNDLAIGPGGKIYVSDSGIKPMPDGSFGSTGSEAVYVIEKGKVKPIAKGKEVAGANGLAVTDKGLLVNSLTSNELYRLDEKGMRQDINKLPAGGLDGLLAIGDELYVSSWQGAEIFKGKLNDKFEPVYTDMRGPADIGFDSKRKRILVPRFLDNAVEVYELK